jgi:hypothetical protein
MTSEKSENAPASPRSEAMRAAWAKRKASAAREAARCEEWFANPVCFCSCNKPLVRQKNPRKQRFFLQGHDAKLKALAARIVKGEASKNEIPGFAKDLRSNIKFLMMMPELRPAFTD